MKNAVVVVALVGLGLLAGCASTRPVQLSSAAPGTAPGYMAGCLERSEGCALAASTSAWLGDRPMTGQALLLGASSAPESSRGEVARVAVWLAPSAWANDAVVGLVPAGAEVPDVSVPEGALLVFRGARAPSGAPAVMVDLAMPDGDDPMVGAALASRAAAAVGARGSVYRASGRDWLVPATPLLNVLLGAPIAPSPASAVGAASWAGELAAADRAYGRGEPVAALEALRRGLSGAPEGWPVCRGAAVTQLGAWVVSASAGDVDSELLAAAEAGCVSAAELPEGEVATSKFLKHMIFLATKASGGGLGGGLREEVATAEQRATYRSELEALAPSLSGVRGALLVALLDELDAANASAEGPCDAAFAERQAVRLSEIRGRLRAMGREDLAMRSTTAGLVDKDRALQAGALSRMLDEADRPERAWLRSEMLRAALSTATFSTRGPETATVVRRLCGTVFEDLDKAVTHDTAPGASGRNATRLASTLTGLISCPDREPINGLTDRVFESALQSGEGHVSVLVLLLHSSWQMIGSLLGGQGNQAFATLQVLRDGMQRVIGRLGETPDDKALGASLEVIVGAIDTLFGQPTDLRATLQRAVTTFDGLRGQPLTATTSTMLRLSGGLHLAALGLAAGNEAIGGDEAALAKALDALDGAVEQDVRTLLAAFEVEGHADEIVAVVKTVQAIARAVGADKPDLEGLFKALAAADKADAGEQGWWRVGLDVARAVAWDVGAVLAHRAGDTTRFGQALERGDAVLRRMVEGSLDEFGLRGSGWELLELTPAIQNGVIAAIITDEDDTRDKLAPEIARLADEAIGKGLARISPEVRGRDLGFLNVVLDGLELAREVGLVKLVSDKAAVRAWMEAWNTRSVGYKPEYRFLTDIFGGLLAFQADPATGASRLARAREEGSAPAVADVAYAADLLLASGWLDAGQPDKALAAVDAGLESGASARACGASHEVYAALPFRALTLERLGQHAEADKTLAEYIGMMEAGFVGDGQVRCQIFAFQPNFTMQAEVAQNVQALFFPINSEGTFNVGAGFESHNRDHTRMVCTGAPSAGFRHDLLLTAHLMRAVYAMRAGDDKGAHLALVGASRIAYRLMYGSQVTLSAAQFAGLEESRKKTYLKLLAWVGAMAQVSGHTGPANNLRLVGAKLFGFQETTWSEVFSAADVPPQLAGLGLEAFSDVARTWASMRGPEDVAAYKTALEAASVKGKLVSKGSVPVLVALANRTFKAEGFGKEFKKLRAPKKDPVAERMYGSLWALVTLEAAPEKVNVPALEAVVVAMAAAGHFEDMVEFVAQVSNVLWEAKKIEETMALTRKALSVMPRARASRPYGMLLLWLSNLDPRVARDVAWAIDVTSPNVLEALHGTIDPELELRVLFSAATGLSSAGRYDLMARPVAILRQIAELGLGAANPLTLNVQILDLSLRAVEGSVDPVELVRLEAAAKDHPELDPQLKELLRRMVDECGDPDACRRYGEIYLQSFR